MLYTVQQAAKRLGLTPRAVQSKCRVYKINKKGRRYYIPERVIEDWENTPDQESKRTANENEAKTNEPQRSVNENDEIGGNIIEEFTPEQYEKLQEVINQYPNLLERIQDYKNEIEYLRKSLDKRSEQMDILLSSLNKSIQAVQQTNYLQAKDKGYDTD